MGLPSFQYLLVHNPLCAESARCRGDAEDRPTRSASRTTRPGRGLRQRAGYAGGCPSLAPIWPTRDETNKAILSTDDSSCGRSRGRLARCPSFLPNTEPDVCVCREYQVNTGGCVPFRPGKGVLALGYPLLDLNLVTKELLFRQNLLIGFDQDLGSGRRALLAFCLRPATGWRSGFTELCSQPAAHRTAALRASERHRRTAHRTPAASGR